MTIREDLVASAVSFSLSRLDFALTNALIGDM
jgi:hypothetical protein